MEQTEAIPTPEPAQTPVEAEAVPAPISADTVVSKPPEAVPAPDSSILSGKLDQMLSRKDSISQRRTQEAEFARLQEEVRILRTLKGGDFDAKYDATADQVVAADDGQSTLMTKLQQELESMKQNQTTLQQRLEEKSQQAELQEAASDVSDWVKTQSEEFPLINKIDQQPLVFQKMWNTKQQTGHMISETQATREIEQELAGIVEKCAPLLGFQRSEQIAGSEAQTDEQISLTSDGLNISEPVDRENMSPDQWTEYLINQFQNG
jgi:hypothetical protein